MVLDVKGAYLKSEINMEKNEKLHLRLPNGRLVKLKKYLYGLKQAGAEWHDNITATLVSNSYQPSVDPLICSKWSDDNFIIMSVHVDDFYVISNTKSYLNELYDLLVARYKNVSRKMNATLTYLGMAITRNHSNHILVTQPAYIDKILTATDMLECSGCTTPMSTDQSFNDKFNNEPVNYQLYLKHVGLINYLAGQSRPDLLYSLSRAAQHCSSPKLSDMKRIKRIIRYIKHTKDIGITFNCDNDMRLIIHIC